MPHTSLSGTESRLRRGCDTFELNVDYTKAIPIAFEARLPESAAIDTLLLSFARQFEEQFRPGAQRSTAHRLTEVLSCLLANLISVYKVDPTAFVGISLRREFFTESRYRQPPGGLELFKRAIDGLRNRDPQLLLQRRGFNDPQTGVRRGTKLRATSALIDLVVQTTGVTRVTDISPSRSGERELIRLKNEDGELIPYEDTPETEAMRTRLRAWNRFAALHWIDLAMPDGQSAHYRPGIRQEWQDEEREGLWLPDFNASWLYRVFNRERFDRGGRFYGGWWQNVSSTLRKRITINGAPVRELDYSNMQIAMLYARVGVPLGGDAYQLDGVSETYRKAIKRALLTMINAEGTRTRAPPADTLPMPWRELCEAVKARHRPIAEFFHSGVGLELQRIDSAIAETVMMKLGLEGILALPIHDSFLVETPHADRLKREMTSAYAHIMGAPIGVDVELSFADEIISRSLPREMEMDELLDLIEELEFDPRYSNYNHRRRNHIRLIGEQTYRILEGRYEGGPYNHHFLDLDLSEIT